MKCIKINIVIPTIFCITTMFILSFFCSCGKESLTFSNSLPHKSGLELRNGDNTLLDLLGNSCLDLKTNIVIPGWCNDTTYLDTIDITGLNLFPGCSFKIVFKYYICQLGNLMDITVGDYQIISHDCPGFSQYINDNFHLSIFSNFIQNFDLQVYLKLEEYFINIFATNNLLHPCGTGVYFNITFVSASCYKYCWYTEFDPIRRISYDLIAKVACGTDCCERHTKVCVLPDGSLSRQTYIAPHYPPYCIGENILISEPIPINCIDLTNCTYRCPLN